MFAKARQNGPEDLTVEKFEGRDGVDFPGFNFPRFDVPGFEWDLYRNVLLGAGYCRVVLVELQHRIVLVEDLNADTACSVVSGSDVEDIAISYASRPRTGELIINFCPGGAVGDVNPETTVSQDVGILAIKIVRIDRFKRYVDVFIHQVTGVCRDVNTRW